MQRLRGIDGEYDSDSAASNRLALRYSYSAASNRLALMGITYQLNQDMRNGINDWVNNLIYK